MKYEFNVGDYVETISGNFGYISHVEDTKDDYYILVVYSDKGAKKYCCGDNYIVDEGYSYTYERLFKRIGKYDFAKKEYKIEPLGLSCMNLISLTKNKTTLSAKEEMFVNKINEIIDYINKRDS